MKPIYAIAVAILATTLQACAPIIVGGAAAGTVVVAEDKRTTGTMVDDQGIELKIDGALDKDRRMSPAHINVISMNGIVLLSGEVPTPALRAEAEEIARKTEKVRLVHDELQVGPNTSFTTRTKDTWITTKIVSKLLGDQGTSETRVKVVTENGTVFLMGLVSRKEADRAVAVAQNTDGVKRIVKLFEYVD